MAAGFICLILSTSDTRADNPQDVDDNRPEEMRPLRNEASGFGRGLRQSLDVIP